MATWDNPKCTDAVSDIYMIFPSGATTNMKPSNVCNKWDPSSFIDDSRGLLGGGAAPHASPKPAKKKNEKRCNNVIYGIIF